MGNNPYGCIRCGMFPLGDFKLVSIDFGGKRVGGVVCSFCMAAMINHAALVEFTATVSGESDLWRAKLVRDGVIVPPPAAEVASE